LINDFVGMSRKKQPPRIASSSEVKTVMLDRIVIDEARVLRIQGYRDPQRIRPTIKRAAAAAARETETLIQPSVCFRFLSVRSCKDGILQLDDGTTLENDGFDRFLDGVRQVTVFILTMGHPLDQAVKHYIADDQLLNALFLETAGWLGIEAATKQFSIRLKKLARETNFRLSPRLGPGYSYKLDGRSVVWPLEQQKTIFDLFAGNVIDIELLESCVMLPKISRSGLFGLLPKLGHVPLGVEIV
jgi:hypothetical protein